jgi:scyllo-inositol 2-dehydrogenase (NADP+)
MFKVGIIGFGRMGITHYSIINSHPDVSIVAVADTAKTMLSILKKYIPHLRVYTDYRELIDQSKPDAILVCTPPDLHYPVIQHAFEKRIHVFCEKPFTADLSKAKELTELYSSANLVNQVGYANRFRDVFVKVKELLGNGIIGDVVRFRSEMSSATIIKKSDGTGWRDNARTGGGVIFEMASHLIDLDNFLFGVPADVTGTVRNKLFSRNVDDHVSATLCYRNGLHGTVFVNWSDESYRKPMITVELFGTRGKLIMDFYGYKIFLNRESEDGTLRKGWNTFTLPSVFEPVPFYVRGNEFTAQLYRFADLVSGKDSERESTFADALDTHIVIDRMLRNTQ